MRWLGTSLSRLFLLVAGLAIVLYAVDNARPAGRAAAAVPTNGPTGSVSGVLTYTGSMTGTISVRLLMLPVVTPYSTTLYPPGGAYAIIGIPDGIYTCFAFLDVNGSWWPDYGEPQAVYQDQQPITISGGAITGIDISLDDTVKGRIVGFVDIQGRADNSGANVTITGVTRSSQATGGFLRLLPMSQTYAVTLSLPGYLSTWGTVPLTAYQHTISTITSPIVLRGGDADHDDDIDITDLTLLGASFGAVGGNADINGDGVVNVFDIVMAGANFGRRAPTPWPPQPPAPPAPPPP